MTNKKLKLIFAGTPEFSVPTLSRIDQEGYEVSLVLTQPDRRSGRGMNVKASPIKQKATELNIPIYQPNNLRHYDVHQRLKAEKAWVSLEKNKKLPIKTKIGVVPCIMPMLIAEVV